MAKKLEMRNRAVELRSFVVGGKGDGVLGVGPDNFEDGLKALWNNCLSALIDNI